MLSKNMLVFTRRTLNSFGKSVKFSRRHCVWSQDNVVSSTFQPIELPNCTLYDYVWQNLEKWPERTVSVCAVTGRGYTYEQAFKLSNAFAANLRLKFKIQDGDVVAVMLPNIPDFPLVTMGILEAGGIISTINPIYTAHEVQRQLLLSEPKVIVTLPETTKTVKDALKLAKLEIPVIVVKTNGESTPEGTVVFNELSEDVNVDKSCLKKVRRSIEDVCFLPYSSGTTGLPKGVELTFRNIIANCEQLNEKTIRAGNDTTATHQDSIMAVLPFFHIYGASVIMFHKMSLGMKMVTMAKFQPEDFIKGLAKHKTNALFAVPPLILLLGLHPASNTETLQHLDIIINGASPLAATDAERFFKKVQRKVDFRQGYGLTETSPVVTMTPQGLDNYGCVGIPLPSTQLKIVDGEGMALGPNKTGELLVKGPQVMKGYKNNPEGTKATFTEDGWFKTGDLSHIDEKGIVTIADRLKELIKVKGFQVPPAELEAVLRDHPAVDDSAVIGIKHATNGEAPKAFIVLKKGEQVDANHIKDFVKERVASYKRIHEIVFVDSIPKSSTGKILRKDLKEKYC